MLKFQLFKADDSGFEAHQIGGIRQQLMMARKNYVENPKTYENDLIYAIQTSIYACKVITEAMVYRGVIEIYPWETPWNDYI